MCHAVMEDWLDSGKPAILDSKRLWPIPHHLMPGVPHNVERGQAVVYFLQNDNASNTRQASWILKKFRQGKNIDRAYLAQVIRLLPKTAAFRAGTDRCVLSSNNVSTGWTVYHKSDFRNWIDGTLLMPVIDGLDWAAIAEDVRAGSLRLDRKQRVGLCRTLSTLVQELESRCSAHRDLSAGNILIVINNGSIGLIDFEGFFDVRLSRPAATTCGTDGYIAPFTQSNGRQDAALTWTEHADRFALAILNTEFLVVGRNWPSAGDGSLFDQAELNRRGSATISRTREALKRDFLGALRLFDRAISSRKFDDCPSPEDWIRFCDDGESLYGPKPIAPMAAPDLSVLREVLARRSRVGVPKWSNAIRLTLPSDPWKS